MHVAQCPSCHKQSPSRRYKFQLYDLDLKIKCGRCNCGALWHTGKVHASTGNVEPSHKSQALSKPTMEKASCQRLQSNAPFEQILDDDLRLEAKRAGKSHEQDKTSTGVEILSQKELRANMLSPNLRQRFAYLLA